MKSLEILIKTISNVKLAEPLDQLAIAQSLHNLARDIQAASLEMREQKAAVQLLAERLKEAETQNSEMIQ